MMTASAAVNVLRSTATMRGKLSPTFTCSSESMPLAASCWPMWAELVSTIWPSNSSVPMATTSQRTVSGDPGQFVHTFAHVGSPHVLPTADERQDDRRPQQTVPQPLGVQRGERQDREAHRQLLRERLPLRSLAGRNADAFRADERSIQ